MLSFIAWSASFSFVMAVAMVPFLGPFFIVCIVLKRWHWTLFAVPRHASGLRWHIPYFLLGPLAVAGALVLSTATAKILQHYEVALSLVQEFEVYWMIMALPMAAKIISIYAAGHELINNALNIRFKWMPEDWWSIALHKNALVLPDLFNQSWGTIVLILALSYVIISFLNHMHLEVLSAVGKVKIKGKRSDDLIAIYREQHPVAMGHAPAMKSGKPSAFEF